MGLGKGPILDRMVVLPTPMVPGGGPLRQVPPLLRRDVGDLFPLVGGMDWARRGGGFDPVVVASG